MIHVKTPDPFVSIREYQKQLKSSNLTLHQMEFHNHKCSISQYQYDMMHHSLYMESKSLPNLQLIEQQPEIKLSMRPMLLDFLMEVITILNLSRSTFPLTVNLIDRYCSTRIVKKQHYQLLGLTSLWIACKNVDQKVKIPTLQDLKKICLDCYYKDLFIEMEKHILKSLEWNINSPTVDIFIDLYLNFFNANELISINYSKIKVFSNYIGELFQFYPNVYFDYTSSQIGLICILLSILILKIPININTLLNYVNNDIIQSKQFQKLSQDQDEEDRFQIDEIISLTNLQKLFNKTFFRNLLKMIESPPKSLEIKYFKEKGRFTKLMKQLLITATESLNVLSDPPQFQNCTSSISTPKYMDTKQKAINHVQIPLTPISNSTSPKREQILIQKPTTHHTNTGIITPESRTSPGKKRSYDCIDELEICQSTIQQHMILNDELKRSKSIHESNPLSMFYIPY